jgi:ABC-type uncharacterized transport system substrate-binding protein
LSHRLRSSGARSQTATTTIPIVVGIVADPVQTGLVASLNRPGGNATGISYRSTDIAVKRLGLLHELKPHATHFAMLVNPRGDGAERLTGKVSCTDLCGGREVTRVPTATAATSSRFSAAQRRCGR